MQSSCDHRSGLHVAAIMDGNGRWATARGLPRTAGHRAGVEAIRRVAEAAPDLGIGTLTLFAFSSDNWRRPPAEVAGLMSLLRRYLRHETGRLARTGTRLTVIGRRDRLPAGLPDALARAEAETEGGERLHLRIAVDYSARDAILAAAAAGIPESREAFGRLLSGGVPDVDLLIRSGGEKRLSDFLLWECAYAELHFSDRMWPDFGPDDLAGALRDFAGRERRFGGLGSVPAAA
ncbi:di-trans,poly-cis-decaprenylcistransferase [Methylobacterium nodulans]|uniref:Isoprenyl transferase n=1 Tax=Methylobacterium nodulans (strain LMG 21967 / CNCM I-2342 / ORS 2060) TaxID=460265 RepID=B8IPX1_METNO|nr:di-trans,poly-cis-decaprenylcistransferase [Methylobacterium nodulans]ACL56621.1 undecaprenyl diphosphate synthase [Methylobacterium nodulans ORS 2060]